MRRLQEIRVRCWQKREFPFVLPPSPAASPLGDALSGWLIPRTFFSLSAPLPHLHRELFPGVRPAVGLPITLLGDAFSPAPHPRCSSAGNTHLPPVCPAPQSLTSTMHTSLLAAALLWRCTRSQSFSQVPSLTSSHQPSRAFAEPPTREGKR